MTSATSHGLHSRSNSLAATSSSASGSFGKADGKKAQGGSEFDKYAEDDEEDYEDVFGKVNLTCE